MYTFSCIYLEDELQLLDLLGTAISGNTRLSVLSDRDSEAKYAGKESIEL